MRYDTKLFQSTPPVKAATIINVINIIMHLFQSTPPVKAATISATLNGKSFKISIHAAREGGDFANPRFVNKVVDFNPRRP